MNFMRNFLFVMLLLGTYQLWCQQGLQAEYYNGTNFQTKVISRVDRAIDFDWPRGVSPAAGVEPSFFSARWTGKLQPPKSGRYTFSAKVDDGIRVWVGGKKVIDAWDLHDSEDFSGSIELAANQQYDLKVEYFNDIFEGEIHLLWVMPGESNALMDLFKSPAKPVDARYFVQPAAPKPVEKPALTSPLPKKNTAIPNTVQNKPVPKPVEITRPPARKPAVPATKPAKKPVAAKSQPKKKIASSESPKKKTPPKTGQKKQQPAAKPASTPPPASTPVTAPPAIPPAEIAQKQRELELKPIYFVQSKDEILPASKIILDNWVVFLQQKTDAVIYVKGHTDDLGAADKNQELSEKRAKLVAEYLVEHGLDENRIQTRAYGSTQPIFVNPASEKDRAMNRRVEIRVKKGD